MSTSNMDSIPTDPQCISRGGCMRPEECRRQGICMRPAVGMESPPPKHKTYFDTLPEGHDPDIGPDGICRICNQYEPE